MNDPNGLSFVDGRWHAFYQHHPHDDVWGSMHWRHATSADLLHWEDHGIALSPLPIGAIFSGSLVVDHEDTAGFGPGSRVAVFTIDSSDGQCQGIAHSTDSFDWIYIDDNPVLPNPGLRDFRDPKVCRVDGCWVMALAVGDRVEFYRSSNLVDWELAGAHQPETPPAGTIECPDLIEISTLNGEPGFVLMYGDDRAGDHERGATMAVAGSFDGSVFEPWGRPELVDHGPDFYAAQSFAECPIDAPVVLGWMNSWRYANEHPSAGRRGVLSLPRRLEVPSVADPRIRIALAAPLGGVAVDADLTWFAQPAVGIGVELTDGRVLISSTEGLAVEVSVRHGSTHVERPDIGLAEFETDVTVVHGPGVVGAILDHGTLELFLPNGQTMSFLVFAGENWFVDLEGDARPRELS